MSITNVDLVWTFKRTELLNFLWFSCHMKRGTWIWYPGWRRSKLKVGVCNHCTWRLLTLVILHWLVLICSLIPWIWWFETTVLSIVTWPELLEFPWEYLFWPKELFCTFPWLEGSYSVERDLVDNSDQSDSDKQTLYVHICNTLGIESLWSVLPHNHNCRSHHHGGRLF